MNARDLGAQRRRLEIRQRARQGVGTQRRVRRSDGALVPDEHRHAHEKLGDVGATTGVVGAVRRIDEVDDLRAVRGEKHVAGVESTVRDTRRVEQADLGPHRTQHLVGELGRNEVDKPRAFGLASREDCGPGTGAADHEDVRHPCT